MRKNLAARQEAMRKKLLAARETHQHCAFRENCEHNPSGDPELCSRCSPSTLRDIIRRQSKP